MRSRQDIIELFSTFLQFETERLNRWAVDTRLRRNMQRCLEQSPAAPVSEGFWAFYWYKNWQAAEKPANTFDLPSLHLSAYLQEPCYWAAQQTLKKFTNIQYKLPDYFQMAIAEVNTVLKGFNPDRGASLKTYAGIAFPGLLRDGLRQRHAVDLCTDWLLLRKVSKKRLTEALYDAGLPAATIPQYRLAWVCFKVQYVPSTPAEKLPKPDSAFWAAVAELYNAERQNQLISPGSPLTAETIERWLSQCAVWIRAYLYPSVASLNAPRPGLAGEVQDDLPVLYSESLLTEMIAQEDAEARQMQRSQLSTILKTALEQLEPQSQQMIQLYYQQRLTQQQIMQQMAMSQASVSRRLSRARESLLKALVRWSQEVLNNSPTPTLIKSMSTALEEWLNVHYASPL
jgi:RNA polymerase sigma factor (sigma-70 family)